jgi:hypothetical protein
MHTEFWSLHHLERGHSEKQQVDGWVVLTIVGVTLFLRRGLCYQQLAALCIAVVSV